MSVYLLRIVREWSISHAYRAKTRQVDPENIPEKCSSRGVLTLSYIFLVLHKYIIKICSALEESN